MRNVLAFLLFAAASVHVALPQAGLLPAENPANLIHALSAGDGRTRMHAFETLTRNFPHVLSSAENRPILIALLRQEVAVRRALKAAGSGTSDALGEDFTAYQGDVAESVIAVARQTGSPDAIQALLESCDEPRADVGVFLSGLGPAIFPAMLARAQSSDANDRRTGLGVLAEALRFDRSAGKVSPIQRAQIKKLIVAGIQDSDYGVKVESIRNLGLVGDASDIPLLKQLEADERPGDLAVRLNARMAVQQIEKDQAAPRGEE